MRDTYERLRDIQEAITRIMKYTEQGRAASTWRFCVEGKRVQAPMEGDHKGPRSTTLLPPPLQ